MKIEYRFFGNHISETVVSLIRVELRITNGEALKYQVSLLYSETDFTTENNLISKLPPLAISDFADCVKDTCKSMRRLLNTPWRPVYFGDNDGFYDILQTVIRAASEQDIFYAQLEGTYETGLKLAVMYLGERQVLELTEETIPKIKAEFEAIKASYQLVENAKKANLLMQLSTAINIITSAERIIKQAKENHRIFQEIQAQGARDLHESRERQRQREFFETRPVDYDINTSSETRNWLERGRGSYA